jgi:hypothetical protein
MKKTRRKKSRDTVPLNQISGSGSRCCWIRIKVLLDQDQGVACWIRIKVLLDPDQGAARSGSRGLLQAEPVLCN